MISDNVVFTYYQPINSLSGDDKLQILIWKKTWEKHGWRTIVLNKNNIMIDELFTKFLEIVKKFPSVNSGTYDIRNYIKYMLMHQIGGGLLTDYDIINNGFEPKDLAEIIRKDILVNLHGTNQESGCCYGSKSAYLDACKYMESYDLSNCKIINGRKHTSEECILCKWDKVQTLDIAKHYSISSNWIDGKIIHFATNFTKTRYKSELMNKFIK